MFLKSLSGIFLSFIIIFLPGCKDTTAPKDPIPVPQVDAQRIKTSTIPRHNNYIGVVKSVEQVDIRARVEGFLTEVNFVEGSPVKKGELLFVIDPKPFEANVAKATGHLQKVIAAKDFAKVQYERMAQLVKKGDISKSEYDKAVSDYESAVGEETTARAELEEAKINLSYAYMYSPVDGIIGKKYVDIGNLVGGGVDNTLLATVIQLHPIHVEFNPSVSDFSEMLNYQDNMPFPVEVRLPFNEKVNFQGKLDLIDNQADIQTSTILMRATVENEDNLLVPGIYVDLDVLLTPSAEVLLVPATAVTDVQGEQTVLVINDQNIVEVRGIKTIGQHQHSYIVSSGLDIDDLVIVQGIQKIPAGTKVIPNIVE